MRVIAVVNQKGGVAKTTSVYNLAVAKAQQGKQVLMVDLDPQASLTISCGLDPDAPDLAGHHVEDVLRGQTRVSECCFGIEALDKSGVVDNLSIVPASLGLAKTENKLCSLPAKKARLQLHEALNEMEQFIDYVIIDCPPQFSLLTINALMAATDCIIPTKVDYLSYRGLQNVLRTISEIQATDLNPNLKFIGVFATFFRQAVSNEKAMVELIRKESNLIGIVKESADVGKGTPFGLPVVIAVPKSPASIAYQSIARKL